VLPLHLAPVTVIKLHGDYAHLPLRNTPEELDAYPRNWKRLLRDVFDQYGLIVIGWSATYDKALAEATSPAPAGGSLCTGWPTTATPASKLAASSPTGAPR
jgi:hypothetical protein